MTKGIKKSIIGFCISLFLWVLGIVLTNTSPWLKIPDENFQIVIAIIAGLCSIGAGLAYLHSLHGTVKHRGGIFPAQ